MLQHPEYLPDSGVRLSIPMGASPLVAHRAWREACDRVLASVRAGEGLILVLGASGTGKSLLLRELARMLGDAGYDVLLQPRGDIPIEVAEAGAGSSGKPGPRIVLIDEADRMNGAALERLGQLGARSFVLARMAGSGDGSVRLPVPATIVRLEPLPLAEIGAFAAARLARAGRHTLPLDEGAVLRLAEHSGGVPRVLDMLVSAAAFLAATEDAERIEAAHVDRAAAMRDGDDAVPGATPVPPEADNPPQDAEPESRPATVVRQLPSPGRTAALSAAVGVAAFCGWLALRPGEQAQRAQPSLVEPAAEPAAPPSISGQGAEARRVPASAGTAGPGTAMPPARLPEKTESWSAEMLPAGAPAHVVIYYVRGDADAATRADDLVRMLRAAGIAAADPVAAAPRATRPGVRYFFAEDQQAASTVLEWAGLSAEDLLAGAARPGFLPRPGMIEVTVPSS